MMEALRHAIGLCGEHWHPNIFTAIASTPFVATAVYYIKCKCGVWFKHNKSCNK